METLPTQDLRSNLATFAVPSAALPAVARIMVKALPKEPFDPDFFGQQLATTYFDTKEFDLRKARRKNRQYLTVRVRSYQGRLGEVSALSVKTESQKFRIEIHEMAAAILRTRDDLMRHLVAFLPGDLLARLAALTGDRPLAPVVTVWAQRYAVENEADRLTLDVAVSSDTGKYLPQAVLEFKSTDPLALPPEALVPLGLRPIKLSKFLWSTAP